jgi:hypothetical protein
MRKSTVQGRVFGTQLDCSIVAETYERCGVPQVTHVSLYERFQHSRLWEVDRLSPTASGNELYYAHING